MDLVVVYNAPSLELAEMLRELLENEHIPAMVRSVGLPPYIAASSADILVPAEREEEARRAVAAFLTGAPEGPSGSGHEPGGGR